MRASVDALHQLQALVSSEHGRDRAQCYRRIDDMNGILAALREGKEAALIRLAGFYNTEKEEIERHFAIVKEHFEAAIAAEQQALSDLSGGEDPQLNLRLVHGAGDQ